MLLPESPHFHSRCPTCLLANLKFCSPSSLFLIIQIKSTRKCCKMHFQNRSRIHSLTTIFPAHTPDKQQPPQPGPCAVSLRFLCASLALHLLTLHSSLADASREQSQQVLPCSYHPMTPLLTEIKSIPSNILEAHRIWPVMGSERNSFSFSPSCLLALP